MSVFTQILEKLGLKKPPTAPQGTAGTTTGAKPAPPTMNAPAAPPKPSAPAGPGAPSATSPSGSATGSRTAAPTGPAAPGQQAPTAPKAISEVDVVKQLEEKAHGSGLDWKVSIVDLLKLL